MFQSSVCTSKWLTVCQHRVLTSSVETLVGREVTDFAACMQPLNQVNREGQHSDNNSLVFTQQLKYGTVCKTSGPVCLQRRGNDKLINHVQVKGLEEHPHGVLEGLRFWNARTGFRFVCTIYVSVYCLLDSLCCLPPAAI